MRGAARRERKPRGLGLKPEHGAYRQERSEHKAPLRGLGGTWNADAGTPLRPGAAWRPLTALPRCRCPTLAAAALTGPAAGAVTSDLTINPLEV